MAWFEDGSSHIYYEDTGGAGETVLFLPGLTDSIEGHSPLREALQAAGYRVIAADLPGSGRSQPQPRIYTATYFEDDARSFAALLKHVAVEFVHLVGFSDGGEVAILMAPGGLLQSHRQSNPAAPGVQRAPYCEVWQRDRPGYDAKRRARHDRNHRDTRRGPEPIARKPDHMPSLAYRGRARPLCFSLAAWAACGAYPRRLHD